MTHQDMTDQDLPFSPDFAKRVVAEAGAIATRRRRVRYGAGVVSGALLIGAIAMGTSQTWLRDPPATQHIPRMIASTELNEMPFAPRRQTTVMDIMFPHAAAVAEFYDRYGTDGTNSPEDDAVFFPEAEGVAASAKDS
jgi:hypothetical protein